MSFGIFPKRKGDLSLFNSKDLWEEVYPLQACTHGTVVTLKSILPTFAGRAMQGSNHANADAVETSQCRLSFACIWKCSKSCSQSGTLKSLLVYMHYCSQGCFANSFSLQFLGCVCVYELFGLLFEVTDSPSNSSLQGKSLIALNYRCFVQLTWNLK